MAFEEDEVGSSELSDLPTLVCSQDLLQGEKLDETFIHCSHLWSIKNIIAYIDHFDDRCKPNDLGLLPNVNGEREKEKVHQYFSDIFAYHVPVDHPQDLHTFRGSYIKLVDALLKVYQSGPRNQVNYPIPHWLFPVFQRLLQEGPTSAIYVVLTFNGVQIRAMFSDHSKWHGSFSGLLIRTATSSGIAI